MCVAACHLVKAFIIEKEHSNNNFNQRPPQTKGLSTAHTRAINHQRNGPRGYQGGWLHR